MSKKKTINEKVLKMWESCNKNENLMKEELHKSGMGFAEYSYALSYFQYASPKNEDSENIVKILTEIIAGVSPGYATIEAKK